VKTLLLTLAATGTIGFTLAAPLTADAAQVFINARVGTPVVLNHSTHARHAPQAQHRPQAAHRPAPQHHRPSHHAHRHGHHYGGGRHFAHDRRWHHGPTHGNFGAWRPATIDRVYVDPRLQRR